jgi:DNA adenine methylase
MLENGLVGRDYVEPYAGGASVALSLLFEDYVDRIHINDLNLGIFAFWNAALNATAQLCDLIDRTPVTMLEWQRQRGILADADRANDLELGFATFFLNRTNRSGIIKGGVIGGKEQQGAWKLDARFNKPDLIKRIQKISRHRTRIVLTRMDAADFLSTWCQPKRQRDSFLYLDPPYFVKGAGLYDNWYGEEDHSEVAEKVTALQHPWIVSYDAAPEILALYRGFQRLRYSLTYSAQTRGLGSEVMFFSNGLNRPAHSPSEVSPRLVNKVRAAG